MAIIIKVAVTEYYWTWVNNTKDGIYQTNCEKQWGAKVYGNDRERLEDDDNDKNEHDCSCIFFAAIHFVIEIKNQNQWKA